MKKTFYRIGHTDTMQGVWYDTNGTFTGLIHSIYSFCKNSRLPMPYDENVVGYLSATDSLEDLYQWFPEEDIVKLQQYGYCIMVYETTDYKFHSNHWLINQKTSKVVSRSVVTSEHQ